MNHRVSDRVQVPAHTCLLPFQTIITLELLSQCRRGGGGGRGGGALPPTLGHDCTLKFNEENISSCSMSATVAT